MANDIYTNFPESCMWQYADYDGNTTTLELSMGSSRRRISLDSNGINPLRRIFNEDEY